jgi:hypothetical protein
VTISPPRFSDLKVIVVCAGHGHSALVVSRERRCALSKVCKGVPEFCASMETDEGGSPRVLALTKGFPRLWEEEPSPPEA